MAQQNPALEQTQFGGVVTSGHPLFRPPASATKCHNFRVMPGNWLRLRSGRVKRSATFNAINRLHEIRLADGASSLYHYVATDRADATSWWQYVMVLDSYNQFFVEPITRGNGYTAGDYPAICNARDKAILYNGQGSRNGSHSTPPFTQNSVVAGVNYLGIDAYCPGGPPTLAVADSGIGTSSINYFRTIYVGLCNSGTGHFGNGVRVGQVKSSDPGNVTRTCNITVNALGNLKRSAHPATNTVNYNGLPYMLTSAEDANLSYCFYVTPDGGNVPYLLVDTSGTPVTTQSSTFVLNLDSLVLSTAQEMPTQNFPPRPMSSLCYANGRVYGVPMGGAGTGSADRDFNYVWPNNQLASVCWSAAADDSTSNDFLGIPEESWPLTNRKATPNGQRPKHIAATPDGTRVLVITQTGTFLLEETADGLHTWYTVSLTSGIYDQRTFAVTPYGLVWFDNRKQIVLLAPGAMQLQVLSAGYPDLLKSPANTLIGTYVLDPPNLVDRYQLWLGDGTSVIHDFILGQAYTADGWAVSAAATLLDVSNFPHHVICDGGIMYTHEGQIADSHVPVSDQRSDGSYAEFAADYIGQWSNLGDSRARKETPEWAVTGDAAASAQLAGSPMTISWYGDLASAEQSVSLVKVPQSDTDMAYLGKLLAASKRWYKLRLKLRSHSQDVGATYVSNAATGDLVPDVYGAIWISALTTNSNGNR